MHAISTRTSLALAAGLSVVACGVQLVSGTVIPFVWFPFYLAMFLGTWVGGSVAGLISTGLSAVLVWIFFVPPVYALVKTDPIHYLSATIFLCMGVLVCVVREYLQIANQAARGEGLGTATDPPVAEVAATAAQGDEGQLAVMASLRDAPGLGRGAIAEDPRPIGAEPSRDPAVELTDQMGSAVESVRRLELTWLQAVLDQLPAGIALFDAEGRASTQNRAMRALAGACGAASSSVFTLRRPDGSPMPSAELPVVRALEDGQPICGVELMARVADGAVVPVVASAAPLRGSDGAVMGASMVVHDISGRKEAERLREEWMALVAHDLQQPMNAILLGLDLILRGEVGPRERVTGERIRGSAERLSRMIADLMAVSTIESRHTRLRRQDVELSRFAHDVVERCPEIADRIAIRALSGPVFVSCDRDRLEQVLTNLLTNAAKYGDASSMIEVEVGRDGAHARISVSNRGMGIPGDEIGQVFDRYVRTRAARGSASPGSGLGLYIARGLVEAHGGRIWASSVPGEQTSFHVELPAPRDDDGGLTH